MTHRTHCVQKNMTDNTRSLSVEFFPATAHNNDTHLNFNYFLLSIINASNENYQVQFNRHENYN